RERMSITYGAHGDFSATALGGSYVISTEVKRDMFTGVTKGFGFVEMPGRNHSLAAITALNGKDFKGQPLRVNEAHEFPTRGKRR
ncbi:MAG: hypothetical protein ABL878_02885, partial [Burkholderiales bacterium]